MSMFKFFRHFRNVLRFTGLPASERRLTFYSEGKNYWPHLGGMVEYILDNSDIKLNFITSDTNDPVHKLSHSNLSVFLIDQGPVRNWLFENIETDLFIMTMPDIHQYQVKRSKHPVHYLYTQHSLLSLQMVYRAGAFDHYDTIFCCGPHHIREMRAIEQAGGLKPKTLVEHGYPWLDAIIKEAAAKPSKPKKEDALCKHVLIAPSWGPKGVIESGVGQTLTQQLLDQGHKVTLRPHPETLKHARPQVEAILRSHKTNPNFVFEENVAGQDSLHLSDVMITAWSGAAFDYALGLGKPVISVDVPKKINNPDYQDIPLIPMEIDVRAKLGQVISPDELEALDLKTLSPPPNDLTKEFLFNLGQSVQVGGDWIIDFVQNSSNATKVSS